MFWLSGDSAGFPISQHCVWFVSVSPLSLSCLYLDVKLYDLTSRPLKCGCEERLY